MFNIIFKENIIRVLLNLHSVKKIKKKINLQFKKSFKS